MLKNGLVAFAAFIAFSPGSSAAVTSNGKHAVIGAVRNPSLDGKKRFIQPELAPVTGNIEHPIVTLPANRVCKGEKFYNAKGELTIGSKECDPPPTCVKPGQVGCLRK